MNMSTCHNECFRLAALLFWSMCLLFFFTHHFLSQNMKFWMVDSTRIKTNNDVICERLIRLNGYKNVRNARLETGNTR